MNIYERDAWGASPGHSFPNTRKDQPLTNNASCNWNKRIVSVKRGAPVLLTVSHGVSPYIVNGVDIFNPNLELRRDDRKTRNTKVCVARALVLYQ